MDYQILNLLLRCNKEFSHEKIKIQELSDTECMISSYIYSHDKCSQDEVAIALKTDKTTVGKALASLEKKKCVIRKQDTQDKRIKRLSLSRIGKAKVSKLVNVHDNWLNEIMTCLTKEEKKQFENYCVRLLAEANKLVK